MSTIGKILLALNLVLAGAFLGWAANSLNKTEELKKAKDAEIAKLSKQSTELQSQLDSAQSSTNTERSAKDAALAESRQYKSDAERLQSLLLAARERAELENRDYGIRLRSDGYEFLAFDAASGRWLASDDRLLARHRWSAPLQVELDVDGRRVSLARRDEAPRRDGGTRPSVDDRRNLDAPVPDFGVDASGEFTNFEVRLQTDARGSTWRLRIDSSGDLGVEELVRK